MSHARAYSTAYISQNNNDMILINKAFSNDIVHSLEVPGVY